MYFKRPSFRRGGSTGIGQLTSNRQMYAGGGNIGGGIISGSNLGSRTGFVSPSSFPGFEFLEPGVQNELRSQMKPPSGKGLTKGTRGARLLSQLRGIGVPSASTAGLMSLPFVLPAGLAYMNKPETLAEKKVMQDYGMLDETFGLAEDYNKVMKDRLDARKVGDKISFRDALFMDTETGKYPKILGRTEDREIEEELYGTDAGFLPTPRFDSDQTVNMESIVEEMVPNKKIDDDTPKEKTFDNIYEEEKSKLEKLLGDDDDKGLAAIALSEAIGTPGTIADKAAVLNKSLLGIMQGKKKDKKDIAKLAYTATKELEKAKVMANKTSDSQKNFERIQNLSAIINDTTGTYSDTDKKSAGAQLEIIKESIKVLNPSKTDGSLTGLSSAGKYIDELSVLAKKINKQEKGSVKYNELIGQYMAIRNFLSGFNNPGITAGVSTTDSIIGLNTKKDGGRIGLANGTPMEESIQVSETVGQGQVPTAQTPQLSFEEIRNRLPKEITDDVVRLIAGSNEALQDFSYIRTQGDVDKFNMKYGVTLVLPAQTA